MLLLLLQAIVKGWESVAWALQQMRQSEDESVRRLADGYRGLVAELMTCDGGLFAAVDSVAGNRLFHHVVDSDRVASELVRRVNAGRLDGTVHFLPLNRLQRRTVDVPLLPVAQPMISELHTQPDMAVVLENIFGRTLICEDVAAAQKVARQYKLDCVTLDGDLVRNNGPIRGGFLAGDRLRLPLFASLSKFKDVASQEQASLDQLRLRLADTSRRIDETAHELQRTETKIARLKFDQLRASLASARQELDLLQQSLRAKQDLCRRIRISKKSNCSKIAALDQELTQVLSFPNFICRVQTSATHRRSEAFVSHRYIHSVMSSLKSSWQNFFSRHTCQVLIGGPLSFAYHYVYSPS